MTANATSRATPPLLDVKGLKVAFHTDDGWSEVVKDISFTVNPGETLAIVGESGSGKSVTSLAIMGLLDPRTTRIEGSISLNGTPLGGTHGLQTSAIRGKEIAMIFQEPMTSLDPSFTIGRQLSEVIGRKEGRLASAKIRQRAIELLEKVRIPNASERLEDYPHQFSGGMRQRVMIAMALASRPRLLIADEPTTALDVTVQGQIIDLIKTLQEEEGMSVLFITHDMGVVAEVSDRTLVMFRGNVIESASTTDVFSISQQPYTRALIESVPKLGSMSERDCPWRFPEVDIDTGKITSSVPLNIQPQATETPLLSVRNLVTRFDIRGGILNRPVARVHAVEDVSFDIAQGETLSLVGESGCGKSTTGRSIMRLIKPSNGDIQLDGFDVLNLSKLDLRRMRTHVQMIFQDPLASLNPRMNVGDIIMEPFLAHRLGSRVEADDLTEDLLTKVGLSPTIMHRYPHEFSGGQRQRICIARALSLSPKLIIADESVSALDVSVKAQVSNLLMELQESLGISFLFISHDMAVVERLSHRVAVMRLGEIVEIGPRQAIFNNPQHPYTQKLIQAVPVPDPARRQLKRNAPVEELKSPVRPIDYQAPRRRYRKVGEGHLVME